MLKYFALVFAFFFSLNLFAMSYCIEVRNDTDQPFRIVTTNSKRLSTLFNRTLISSIWYGAKKIEEEEEIPANTKKRLFVTLDENEHEKGSDFFMLQNHRGDFYISFGELSDNCRVSLPVLSDEQLQNVPSGYLEPGSSEIMSKSGVYKAKLMSSRREGAEIITITKAQ